MGEIDYVRFLSGNWQIDINNTIVKYGALLSNSFIEHPIPGAVKCPDHDTKLGNLIYNNLFSEQYPKPKEPKDLNNLTVEEEKEKNNFQNRSKCFHSVCKEKIDAYSINNINYPTKCKDAIPEYDPPFGQG